MKQTDSLPLYKSTRNMDEVVDYLIDKIDKNVMELISKVTTHFEDKYEVIGFMSNEIINFKMTLVDDVRQITDGDDLVEPYIEKQPATKSANKVKRPREQDTRTKTKDFESKKIKLASPQPEIPPVVASWLIVKDVNRRGNGLKVKCTQGNPLMGKEVSPLEQEGTVYDMTLSQFCDYKKQEKAKALDPTKFYFDDDVMEIFVKKTAGMKCCKQDIKTILEDHSDMSVARKQLDFMETAKIDTDTEEENDYDEEPDPQAAKAGLEEIGRMKSAMLSGGKQSAMKMMKMLSERARA